MANNLPDTALDAITTELTTESEFPAKDLVEILILNRDRGVSRLSSLYHRKGCLRTDVQQAICDQISAYGYSIDRPHISSLRDTLFTVISDPSGEIGVRCQAVEAICHVRKRSYTNKEEELVAYEKIYSDLHDLLRNAPEAMTTVMQITRTNLVERDEASRLEYARQLNSWDQFMPIKDSGKEAIEALTDQRDWERVVAAAEALAQNKISDAIPALQKVADEHWFKPVRNMAQQAVLIIQNREPLAISSDTPILKFITDEDPNRAARIAALRSQTGPVERSLIEKAADFLKSVQDEYFWRSQPRLMEAVVRREGRLPAFYDFSSRGMPILRARHAIRFAGGKMIGYAEGEFGSGTAFFRGNETTVFFPTEHVQGFVQMSFGLLVVCHDDFSNSGELYLAKHDDHGAVELALFQRLPGAPGLYELRASGDLFIPCSSGNVIISKDGVIRIAEVEDIPIRKR